MPVPTRIAVLKTGQPVPAVSDREGQFVSMFAARIHLDGALADSVVEEIDLIDAALDDKDPNFEAYDGVIMSGSAAMIDEGLPWMLRATRIAKALAHADTPFLGVCFGHQILGRAMGADVGPNVNGRMMGTVDVTRTAADPLYDHMPMNFPAQVSHVDVIRSPGEHLEVVGTSPHDPCHMVRFGRTTWGVQFHPEFSKWTVEHYIEARTPVVDKELGEGAAAAWYAKVQETDDAMKLLQHFAHFCDEERRTKRAA